jgi:hypothetical protein
MNNNFTLIYIIDDFSENKAQLIDVYEFENEYDDVISALDQFEAEPGKEIIERILKIAEDF